MPTQLWMLVIKTHLIWGKIKWAQVKLHQGHPIPSLLLLAGPLKKQSVFLICFKNSDQSGQKYHK